MSELISFEELCRVQMHVGSVLTAERVTKSKMLRLQMNFGSLGERQILASIGEHFTPEEVVGLSLVAVLNLAPRTMKGLESHGMILATKNAEGKLFLVRADGAEPGGQVG